MHTQYRHLLASATFLIAKPWITELLLLKNSKLNTQHIHLTLFPRIFWVTFFFLTLLVLRPNLHLELTWSTFLSFTSCSLQPGCQPIISMTSNYWIPIILNSLGSLPLAHVVKHNYLKSNQLPSLIPYPGYLAHWKSLGEHVVTRPWVSS